MRGAVHPLRLLNNRLWRPLSRGREPHRLGALRRTLREAVAGERLDHAAAARFLSEAGTDQLSTLLACLGEPLGDGLRKAAAWFLVNGRGASEAALGAALRDDQPSVRIAAIGASWEFAVREGRFPHGAPGSVSSATDVAELAARLRDPNASVRAAAVVDLHRTGRPADLELVKRTLTLDANALVRREAAMRLGLRPDPGLLELLQQALGAEADPNVSSMIRASIEKLGSLAAEESRAKSADGGMLSRYPLPTPVAQENRAVSLSWLASWPRFSLWLLSSAAVRWLADWLESNASLASALNEVVRQGAPRLGVAALQNVLFLEDRTIERLGGDVVFTETVHFEDVKTAAAAELRRRGAQPDQVPPATTPSRLTENAPRNDERLDSRDAHPRRDPGARGLSALVDVAAATRGLFFIGGPAGPARSTVLAAMLEGLAKERVFHILLLEQGNRISFAFGRALVSRRQVGEDVESPLAGADSALRDLPDILSLGPVQSRTLADVALRLAEAGALVLVETEAATATRVRANWLGLYPPPLRGEACERLGRRLAGLYCRIPVPAAAGGEAFAVESMAGIERRRRLFGRATDEELYASLTSGADKAGCVTRNTSLTSLVDQGVIAAEAALDHSEQPEELRQMLARLRPVATGLSRPAT